jgi:complement component 1 Q subcomponent-binding protein
VPPDRQADDEKLYAGPEYNQLAEELQEATEAWLSDRGVDEDLCFFVLAHSRDKEQTEYVRWLEAVLDFSEK